MRKLLFLAVLIVACASMASAQSTDYNKVEFFGGFSHNRVDTGNDEAERDLGSVINGREGFNGFNTSVTGNVSRYFGLKFDLAGHFTKKTFPVGPGRVDVSSSLFSFLGGVQIKDNSKETRIKPFAHALVGPAHARNKADIINVILLDIAPVFVATDTGFAGAFGGGLDFRLNNRVDIRAIQFDYNPTRVFDATQHNFRIGVGIVFH